MIERELVVLLMFTVFHWGYVLGILLAFGSDDDMGSFLGVMMIGAYMFYAIPTICTGNYIAHMWLNYLENHGFLYSSGALVSK